MAKGEGASSTENKRRHRKIALISTACVVVFLVCGVAFSWFGWAGRVVKDTFLVGVDYINLPHPLEKIDWRDMQTNAEYARQTKSHPYVLVNAETFSETRADYYAADGDPYTKERMDYAISEANRMLTEPLLVRVMNEDDEMLDISRAAVNRIMTLAGVWQITHDNRYADRAIDEIMNVCAFEDWHPDHFLDTTEMSFAVSLGFDWLYDYLTVEQRDHIAASVYEYGIAPASPTKKLKNWWQWSKVNWNTQCYGGIGVACMVFSEYYPKETAKFLSAAYYNMPLHFASFSPDGAYVEGNSYWEAMSSYLVYFVSTSRHFFGTDFGLSSLSGFDRIGYFPLYISAPQGVFNFADNRNEPLFSPALHWFSTEYNEPMLSYFQRLSTPTAEYARESLLSCLWYNPDADYSAESLAQVPLAAYMSSDACEEFVTMRSSYCDTDATYVGIKGGYNYSNHGDLDIGSFVFDALGERWVTDLGKASYTLPGYFVGLVGGGRWRVYKKRAEGHNTLVINPDLADEDQYPLARATFSSFNALTGGGKCEIDMTGAYIRNRVNSVTREMEMYDNYRNIRITDTISCKRDSEIWWFAHTDATIEISPDGKTATLTKTRTAEDNTIVTKHVLVKIAPDSPGTFSVTDTTPLSDSKRFEGNQREEGISRLSIHLTDVTDAKIVVTFEPQY